ncbi:MAG: TusE/DsrC/DsvC family sulfur relay protein [Gammaproteobacteria bacterium]|nr:TusE/DsrC/DsvC family sulfur relay protein [Gammaproteobacteria bacterium]
MTNLVVNGENFSILTDGRLANVDQWTPDIANAFAKADGIELTNAHWDLITLMRGYYAKYNTSPVRKLLKREIAKSLGPELANDDYLMSMFPNDIQIQGTRIAGIPIAHVDAEIEHSIQLRKAETRQNTPHYSQEFEFEGKKIAVYPIGNLVNLDDWSEPLAEHMAEKEGIKLTNEHWEVIRYLRKFYFQYGITPMVKLLIKHMAEEHGKDVSNEARLYGLFPKGPSRQGSRLAGLPEPQGCMD